MYNYDSYLKDIKNAGNYIYFKEVIYPMAVVTLLFLILVVLIYYVDFKIGNTKKTIANQQIVPTIKIPKDLDFSLTKDLGKFNAMMVLKIILGAIILTGIILLFIK